jgi:hypothetical protein
VGLLLTKNLQISLMNNPNSVNYSEWSVLSHNVRGINSSVKWNDIRCAIRESGCDVICLQETKKEFFDQAYLKNSVPITLIHLLLFLRWGIRVAPLLFRKVQNWWAMLFFRMIMLNRWNLAPIYRIAPGLLRTFMHHVLHRGKLISSTGSLISICPRISFG